MKNNDKDDKDETDESSTDTDEDQREKHGVVHEGQQKQQMRSRRLSAATAAAASLYASVEPSTNSRIEEDQTGMVEEDETEGMVRSAAAAAITETTVSTVKLTPSSNGQHRKVRGPTNKVEGSVLYFGAED